VALLTIERIEPKPPVGRCIYCRTTDGPLTDEHVLPRGLKGKLVLLKASCVKCQRIINTFENVLLHESWGSTRTQLDLPSYNKKKRRRTARVELRYGGATTTREVPIADAPAFIALPYWLPPGYFTGVKAPDGHFVARPAFCLVTANAGALDQLRDQTLATGMRVPLPVSTYSLARLLAKIAYGYIVYTYGLDQLAEVFVLPGIMGERQDLAWWVGGSEPSVLDSAIPYSPPGLHDVAHTVEGDLVQVFIRLFAKLNPRAPEYVVIVGRLREAAIAQWLSADGAALRIEHRGRRGRGGC
jgi:hypothetical protein